jgi:hypothetical protein
MQRIHLSLLFLIAVFSSGCATMNADECQMADWQVIGYEDGSSGKPSTQIGDHRKACAKHGVSPDLQAYTQGYDKGIRTYCVQDTAFALGKKGQNMPSVCPTDVNQSFSAAYEEGRMIFLDIQKVNKQIAGVDKEIKEINQEIEFLLASKYEVGANGKRPTKQEQEAAGRLIRRQEIEVQELQNQREEYDSNLQRLRAVTHISGAATAVNQ